MTWWRRECGFSSTPAGRAAGLKGRALWAEGIDHCTQNLTDGRIDKHMLPLLSAVAEVGTGRPEARKLVDVGLWVDMGDHWQIPNWNDYQPHRADVEAVKAKKKLAGAEGNHKRWHTDRGIVSDDCEFCQPKPIAHGSHCANETRSQIDRHDTTRHDNDPIDHRDLASEATRTTVVDQAIEILADGEQMDAEYRGIEPDKGWTLYRTGIVKRLNTEHRARLTALHALTPDMPACDLAAVIAEEIYGDYGGRALNDTNGATA